MISGVLLSVVYLGIVGIVLFSSVLDIDQQKASQEIGSVEGSTYRIETAFGDVHMMKVTDEDPANVLIEATRRFGSVASVKRMEPVEGAMSSPETPKVVPSSVPLWPFLVLIPIPVLFFVAGGWLKSRLHCLERFWGAIRDTLVESAISIGDKTALNGPQIQTAIDKINQMGFARLKWDPESDIIFDERLSEHNVFIEFCARCNQQLNERIIADLKRIPRCPSCMFEHDKVILDKRKEPIVRRLHEEASSGKLVQSARPIFSIPLYILLAIVFPPLAVAYALMRI